jgi:hypothetical protein
VDLYALGIADELEVEELREHLIRACPNCLPAVRSSLRQVGALAALVPQVDPPHRLRTKVLMAVDAPRERFNWSFAWAGIAGALLFFAAWLGFQGRDASTRLSQVQKVLNDQNATQLSFDGGRILVSAREGILLTSPRMEHLPAGKAYELWIVPRGSNPQPAGVFSPNPDGSVLYVRPGRVNTSSLSALAVSVEPESGALQPTTKPVIVAPVQ